MNLVFAILSAAVLIFQAILLVSSFGEIAPWRTIGLFVLCVIQCIVVGCYIRDYKADRRITPIRGRQ